MSEMITSSIIWPLVLAIEAGILFRMIWKLMQAQSEEGTLKTAVRSCKKLMMAGAIAVTAPSVLPTILNVLGGGPDVNVLNTAQKVFREAAAAALVLESVYLVFLEISEGLQLQASDPEEQGIHKKKMLEMLGVGIFIITVTAVLPVIWRYFGG